MSTGDDIMPGWNIKSRRDTDTVEAAVENDKTVFSVRSPSGISQAKIERSNATWPHTAVLRLHLHGLEYLRVSSGNVTLEASVSSHDDQPRTRLWMDGRDEAPLDSTSQYWMAIRMIGGDGNPVTVIPPENGYFEMTLPRAFFEGNPRSITVSWIDFYR